VQYLIALDSIVTRSRNTRVWEVEDDSIEHRGRVTPGSLIEFLGVHFKEDSRLQYKMTSRIEFTVNCGGLRSMDKKALTPSSLSVFGLLLAALYFSENSSLES